MSGTTALLVVDCQRYYEAVLKTALPKIERLIGHWRQQKQPIIYTRHGHTKEELRTEPSPSLHVRKWGADNSISRGIEEWELVVHIKQLAETPGHDQIIIEKNTYDAFLNTNLEDLLKQKKVERVVVVGAMTDTSVDTTARSAFNRGFETWVVSDACATASNAQHKKALEVFEFGYGDVVRTNDLVVRY